MALVCVCVCVFPVCVFPVCVHECPFLGGTSGPRVSTHSSALKLSARSSPSKGKGEKAQPTTVRPRLSRRIASSRVYCGSAPESATMMLRSGGGEVRERGMGGYKKKHIGARVRAARRHRRAVSPMPGHLQLPLLVQQRQCCGVFSVAAVRQEHLHGSLGQTRRSTQGRRGLGQCCDGRWRQKGDGAEGQSSLGEMDIPCHGVLRMEQGLPNTTATSEGGVGIGCIPQLDARD